jgi:hypothetical protein
MLKIAGGDFQAPPTARPFETKVLPGRERSERPVQKFGF